MAQGKPGAHPGPPEEAQEPGNDPAQQPSPTPARTAESHEGTKVVPALVTVPGSVLDIGITADQWALLPPLAKKDLLNAAQQSGPPGYRQMTRDYFAKIAKLQESAGN
jgi:hypothetical protein